ncbi:DUF3083 family protein [Psychrobium sp. 1_MG-2023]|uniref:DUF3083 family protein n=1 Tax=Psychrobium sp. 1_MG-2023 TaxID=3062624 RepID=UPI000C34C106|nr:DUF3083 family protein [Psychrobium sp. 1_MG-2023]MDP2560114.1 DUF3083 family protein [Psychrobium sp. 1_MG-2023]PKF56928.1 hypothetical protein CW748_07480 [Alteromonadales bacterium alter-6D02]
MSHRHSTSRKHNGAHKVYISNNSRDNQYLLANIDITDELILSIDPEFSLDNPQPYKTFYKQIRNKLFSLCQKHEVTNVNYLANGKTPMVRFNYEAEAIETEDKVIFFYHPKFHQSQKYFYDFDKRVKRISILFLANGEEIRSNAASFHQQVSNVLTDLSAHFKLSEGTIRIRDHQHLTYDLLGQTKDRANTQAHKFRPMHVRYHANDVELPETHRALTYVIADVSINAKIRKLANVDYDAPAPYNPLYTMITDTFVMAMKANNLQNGAVIANGLTPLVRFSTNEEVSVNKGCQMLGYDPAQSGGGIISKWNPDEFVDTVRLVFMATDNDCTDRGYGKYVNQITKVLETIADKLEVDAQSEQLMVRVHQHIAYDM